jgi:hypothetical protein
MIFIENGRRFISVHPTKIYKSLQVVVFEGLFWFEVFVKNGF